MAVGFDGLSANLAFNSLSKFPDFKGVPVFTHKNPPVQRRGDYGWGLFL